MSTNQLVPDSSTFEISSNAMNLANLGVTGGKIADTTITGGKLASGAVSSTKVTFPLKRNTGGAWWQTRDYGLVFNDRTMTDGTGNIATSVCTVKTKSGSWSLCGLNGNDQLFLSYVPDTAYSSGTNTGCVQQQISPDGTNTLTPNMSKCATYTTTDPGKNSTLAAGKFVFVYEN